MLFLKGSVFFGPWKTIVHFVCYVCFLRLSVALGKVSDLKMLINRSKIEMYEVHLFNVHIILVLKLHSAHIAAAKGGKVNDSCE